MRTWRQQQRDRLRERGCCTNCNRVLLEVEKISSRTGAMKLAPRCTECDLELNIRRVESMRRLRLEVLEHYGRVCACCGESALEFMSIDHVNGGGSKHRKELGLGSRIERWLKHNNFPTGFRILCHNCNQALGHYGYCPHNRSK